MRRTVEDVVRVGRHLAVEGLETGRHHFAVTYLLDGRHRFLTRVLYHDLDLDALAARTDPRLLRRVLCHAALFEGFRFMAVFPRVYDVTPLADGLDGASLEAAREWTAHLWTQHMYENGVADYWGPEVVSRAPLGEGSAAPTGAVAAAGPLLAANGGGKDSLLVMKTLEAAGVPFAAFQQARSEYGRFDEQHDEHARPLRHVPALLRNHLLSVHDDFTDGVFMARYNPDLRGDVVRGYPCQVGSPEMIFNALPLVMARGYAGIVLGNERSADAPQATWEDLGRPVNHQWLKSREAEERFDRFVGERLLEGVRVFSLLRPLHDHRIYARIARWPEALPDIHSCNVRKPWCRRCAKCAYVWISLVATFGRGPVDAVFGRNLLDDPALLPEWRRLLGLEDRNSFECVGTVAETRLAFRTAAAAGVTGAAMDVFRSQVLARGDVAWESALAEVGRLHEDDHRVPPALWEKVRGLL